MGGQVADHGVISADGVTFQVTDVQKNKGGKYMHTGKLTQGVLKVGGTVSASIDVKRAKPSCGPLRHPSAGRRAPPGAGRPRAPGRSLVEPDKLRFDFTHFAALTAEELSQVSALVNEAVLEGYEVSTEVLPIEEAKQRAPSPCSARSTATRPGGGHGPGLLGGVLRRHPSGQHRQGGRIPHRQRVLRASGVRRIEPPPALSP